MMSKQPDGQVETALLQQQAATITHCRPAGEGAVLPATQPTRHVCGDRCFADKASCLAPLFFCCYPRWPCTLEPFILRCSEADASPGIGGSVSGWGHNHGLGTRPSCLPRRRALVDLEVRPMVCRGLIPRKSCEAYHDEAIVDLRDEGSCGGAPGGGLAEGHCWLKRWALTRTGTSCPCGSARAETTRPVRWARGERCRSCDQLSHGIVSWSHALSRGWSALVAACDPTALQYCGWRLRGHEQPRWVRSPHATGEHSVRHHVGRGQVPLPPCGESGMGERTRPWTAPVSTSPSPPPKVNCQDKPRTGECRLLRVLPLVGSIHWGAPTFPPSTSPPGGRLRFSPSRTICKQYCLRYKGGLGSVIVRRGLIVWL